MHTDTYILTLCYVYIRLCNTCQVLIAVCSKLSEFKQFSQCVTGLMTIAGLNRKQIALYLRLVRSRFHDYSTKKFLEITSGAYLNFGRISRIVSAA